MWRDGPNALAAWLLCGSGRLGMRRVDKATRETERRIENEHQLDRGELPDANAAEEFRARRRKRPGSTGQRADQAVACENPGTLAAEISPVMHRMLQGYEHADASA